MRANAMLWIDVDRDGPKARQLRGVLVLVYAADWLTVFKYRVIQPISISGRCKLDRRGDSDRNLPCANLPSRKSPKQKPPAVIGPIFLQELRAELHQDIGRVGINNPKCAPATPKGRGIFFCKPTIKKSRPVRGLN
jgi:hypothetical protein